MILLNTMGSFETTNRKIISICNDSVFSRFRCLLRGSEMHPEGVERVTLAYCILHHTCCVTETQGVQETGRLGRPTGARSCAEEWSNDAMLVPIEPIRNRRGTFGAENVRDYLHFYSDCDWGRRQGRTTWWESRRSLNMVVCDVLFTVNDGHDECNKGTGHEMLFLYVGAFLEE